MSSPLVTIVMPSYNARRFIQLSIQSVLNQTYSEWELLVVDDYSTDNTVEIVKALVEKDSRIEVIRLPSNSGGPATPRNIGVKQANGNYVAFLDSDDIWHPKKLELQMQILVDTNSEFCCTAMRDFVSEDAIIFLEPDSGNHVGVNFKQQQLRARIPTSSVIATKSLLQETPFNESRSYVAVEDYDCWLRILEKTSSSIKLLSPLLFYRQVKGQISGSKKEMARKVFMVHKNFTGSGFFKALFFTVSHVLGGIYFRLIKREL